MRTVVLPAEKMSAGNSSLPREGLPYQEVKSRLVGLNTQIEGSGQKIESIKIESRRASRDDIMRFFSALSADAMSDVEIVSTFDSRVWLYNDHVATVMNFGYGYSSQMEVENRLKQLEEQPETVRIRSNWLPG